MGKGGRGCWRLCLGGRRRRRRRRRQLNPAPETPPQIKEPFCGSSAPGPFWITQLSQRWACCLNDPAPSLLLSPILLRQQGTCLHVEAPLTSACRSCLLVSQLAQAGWNLLRLFFWSFWTWTSPLTSFQLKALPLETFSSGRACPRAEISSMPGDQRAARAEAGPAHPTCPDYTFTGSQPGLPGLPLLENSSSIAHRDLQRHMRQLSDNKYMTRTGVVNLGTN